uniref:CX domain-containing protein n=1 Tax=Caenorhabditis tropicalis TaxID=1561998 RepID=A0A1I7V1Y7_9PELO
MRFLILFCAISALNATIFPFGKLNATMKMHQNVTVIQDPAVPFKRFGVVYYWTGNFKHNSSTPKKCIFLRAHPDWPFGEHLLPNGSVVHGVEFGCTNDDLCRKYRCDKSLSSGLIWCALLLTSSVVSLAIIIRYIIGRRKHQGRTEQDTEMRAYIPIVVVNQGSNGHLEVPPQMFPIA